MKASRRFLPLVLFLGLAAAWSAPLRAEPPVPRWIWSEDDGSATRTGKVFSVTGPVRRAMLRATADGARLRVTLNGKPVLAFDPYDPPAETEVARLLAEGENTLELSAQAVEGPAAIAFSLVVEPREGDPLVFSSAAGALTRLRDLGPVSPRRWALNRLPEVSPFAEYNQWREALAGDPAAGADPGGARLSPLPPGFEIAKIREAAPGEDSWVSLAIDPRGRLLIAKEQKGLLRLTLSDNGGEVVAVETVDDTLEECRGLAWKDGALYAHANRSKALFRLRDTDGDDRFDEIVKLLATEGGTGHGRNDLATGPDGALHAITGDDIAVPASSPRRTRPEAGAPRELGHWARWTEAADGAGTWEVLSRGLRNPYGIDFNADGEPFTYDADNEGDVGLPFYRPTRINHLVSGANYGWHQDRGNTRSLPVDAPDSAPTTFDVGRGSPTGVKFGTRSHFPSPWKEALYALDWAYGRIVAVHLTPNGASYLGSGEVFLEGRPLNVTDLDFDEDGAMWFVTGGRKTQAALYRVRYTGKETGPDPEPGAQEAARTAFAAKARDLRRSLERFHGRADPEAVEALWPHLGSPDPWIRQAARVALEWQPVDAWREKALAAPGDLAGLTALLALSRAGTGTDRAAAADHAVRFALGPEAGRAEKLALLRLHELAGPPERPDQRRRVSDQLRALAPDLSEAVNRELARGLIAAGSPDAVAFALERLAAADDQLERLHYLEALAEAKTGWTAEQRELYVTTLAHAKRFSFGDRFLIPFFQGLEQAALGHLTDAKERERLAARLAEEPEGEPGPAAARPFVKHWTVDELAAPSGRRPDLGRGRELYAAALCARCHVCGTTGRPVGPDLTMVVNRFSRRDLVESIVEPSKVVAEVHRNVIVTKVDGGVVQGRIVQNDFRESKLILSTNPFAPATLVTLPKAEIRSWEESPVSPMPPALLDTLSRDEVEDLLGFLLSGGRVEEAAPVPKEAAREKPEAIDGGARRDRIPAAVRAAGGLRHRIAGTPEPPPPYRSEPALPGRSMNQPVTFRFEPGTGHLLYVDQAPGAKGSRLRRLRDRGAGEPETLLEEAEETYYSLAFHPRYRENGHFFLSRFGPASAEREQRRVQVRRYAMARDGSGRVVDPAGELIVEWLTWGHTGGAMAFDEAGLFYVTTGDGTGDSDTKLAGQDLTHLLAKVLRLDVDRPSADGTPYSIPPDNPFLGRPGVRPETFAYGLRNPWRMAWDARLKRLWVGNNGQDRLEQVYLIERGANYGWSVYEGSGIFYAERPRGPDPVTPPTLEHGHEVARSLTGGMVYEGAALPALTGAYVYGDYATGKIWAARHDGKRVTWSAEIADTTLAITDFGTDPVTGDLLVAHHAPEGTGGGLHRLVPNPPDPGAAPFPVRLGETGLFADLAGHAVRPECLPYEVAVPQWVDGAEVDRYLALPESAPRVEFAPQRGWNLPDGAVAFQTLTREGRRIETRVMVKQAGEWAAYSYAWNAAQTDATLVPAAGGEVDLGGGAKWRIPGRAECLHCHSRAANFVLGLQTAQMNRPRDYGGGEVRNQLEVLRDLGWFDRPDAGGGASAAASLMRDPADRYERLVDPFDESLADIDLRARSYLHGRCSHCHVEAGGGNSTMDLRIAAKAPDQFRVVGHEPVHGGLDLVGDDIRLVTPGDPSKSVLFNRIAKSGRGQMPPVGAALPDPRGVALLTRWIVEMKAP